MVFLSKKAASGANGFLLPARCNVALAALAAVLGEVAQQGVHLGKVGAVNQVATLGHAVHKTCVGEFLEVEGQGAGADVEFVGHGARRQPVWPGHDQRSEGSQALRLRQGSQGFDRG